MKCIAVIAADLQKTALGTRSRLCEKIQGESILCRTIAKVRSAESISEIHLIVPADQQPAFRDLLHDAQIHLLPQHSPSPFAALVRASRWWGLDGWRGGIGSLCAFDEDIDSPTAATAASQAGADTIAFIPAAAPLFDPALLDAMITHHRQNAEQMRLTFTQAPPGLSALILSASLLYELAPTAQPPGALLTYQPDRPFADLTGKEACFRCPLNIVQAKGRLIADTWRSLKRIDAIFAAGGNEWDASRVCDWLSASNVTNEFPEEIEIELTTGEVPGESGRLRPRHPEVPSRGPLDLGVIEAVCRDIGDLDDIRIVLAGFGEPLLHPRFADICRMLRRAGAAAIAVRTGGYIHDPPIEEALFNTPIDVVEVALDAASAETYARVHGADDFEHILSNISRWMARRDAESRVLPLVVPSFIKCTENLDDMEAFFDHWQRRSGMALISGYSHCAAQRSNLSVTSTAPPQREPCRRAFTRAILLADGAITTCDQDFKGLHRLGDLRKSTLKQLWNAAGLHSLRTNIVADLPLCPKCEEWHRP